MYFNNKYFLETYFPRYFTLAKLTESTNNYTQFGYIDTQTRNKQKQYDEQFLLKKRILKDDKEILEILVNFILHSGV